MEDNLRGALGAFASATPLGETLDLDGVTVLCPAVDFAMFNAAVLTAPVDSTAELEDRIATASAYYRRRKLPWSFWLCEKWIDEEVRGGVVAAFRRHRLHLNMEMPGMEAPFVAPAAALPPGLAYRRVADRVTRIDFNHIMMVSFALPFAISRQIYESETTWNGDFAGWVGYRGSEPVAAAATLPRAGVIGLYAVGTLPHEQRRGYGGAVVRHALEQACMASGLRTTVLQASEAGMTLYKRLGYREVARYAVFSTA